MKYLRAFGRKMVTWAEEIWQKRVAPCLLWFYPVQKDKCVFINFNGKGYGCNPKYIAQEILRQGRRWDLVWLVSNSEEKFPKGIRKAPFRRWRGLKEIATAKIIVTNVKNDLCLRKKKGQYIIQTWHASYGAKKVEAEALDVLPLSYIRESKRNSKQTDLFLSNSSAMSRCIREAYWYTGEILECGLPRNDVLFLNDNVLKERIRRMVGIAPGEKVLLYAPTFRDDHSLNGYTLDCVGVLNSLQAIGNQWRLLIRLHPNVGKADGLFPKDPRIKEVTYYPDMQELLMISDILITDYSSTPFDFAAMGKQVIIYSPDLEEYQRIRGLKEDFFRTPYPICVTNAELIHAVKEYTPAKAKLQAEKFISYFGGVDNGTASKRVVEKMGEVISGRKL